MSDRINITELSTGTGILLPFAALTYHWACAPNPNPSQVLVQVPQRSRGDGELRVSHGWLPQAEGISSHGAAMEEGPGLEGAEDRVLRAGLRTHPEEEDSM